MKRSRQGWFAATTCLAGVALAGATAVHARPEPRELLVASETADQRRSYTGTKVVRAYRQGESEPSLETRVRVWHRSPDQTRVEIVTPSEKSGMVMLDNGSESWVFHPRNQRWHPVRLRQPKPRPELLLKNYVVELVGNERIAGRQALGLRVIPRRPGNPSKTIWVDAKTRVPLKQELYDLEGRLLVASEFREIYFEPSIPANLFTVPVEARRAPGRGGAHREAGLKSEERGLEFGPPRYVPPGYVLVVRMRYERPGFEFAHYRYTDGLNTISLFQERRTGEGDGHRGGRWGPDGPPEIARAGAAPLPPPRVPSRATGPSGWGAPERGGSRSRRWAGEPLPLPPPERARAREGRQKERGFPVRDEATAGSVSCGNRLIMMRGDTRYILVGNISASQLQRMADSIPEPSQAVAGRNRN
jgi:outer membrane lipoprotein-sorting protein